MKEIVEKLLEIEKRTSKEKGGYELFALFLREGSANKWDLLVSAQWINKNKEEALKYLSSILQKELPLSELILISRIVLIEDGNPSLLALQKAINVEHGAAEVKESDFFGLQIKHAYLITSKRVQAA